MKIKEEIKPLLKDIECFLESNKIFVDTLSDQSIYIYFEYKDNKVTIILDEEPTGIEALLNIVKNKANICSYSHNIPNVLNKLKEILNNK